MKPAGHYIECEKCGRFYKYQHGGSFCRYCDPASPDFKYDEVRGKELTNLTGNDCFIQRLDMGFEMLNDNED
jgi:hypothetical protein